MNFVPEFRMDLLDVESDLSGSSDAFDQLRAGLPQCDVSLLAENISMELDDSDDKFSRWQMARFNRSGTIDICRVLSSSIAIYGDHVVPLVLLYLIYIFFCVLSFRYELFWVFVPIDAIASLLATSISFSIITSESFSSRLHRLLSLQGFGAALIQGVRSTIYYYIFIGFVTRASTITFRLLLALLVNYLTFFHTCFVFEGLNLSFHETCVFSLNLMFFAIPFMKSLNVFFLGMFMNLAAPFTLGFTAWVGYMIRVFVFIAICGSGSHVASLDTIFA